MTTQKFISGDNTFVQPVCNGCKYHFGGAECAAFKRIPDDILEGRNQHSKPTLHQKNMIVFAPAVDLKKVSNKEGWEDQPRAPAGTEEGGQWVSEGSEITATGIGSKSDRLWQDADGVKLKEEYRQAHEGWAKADKADDDFWSKKVDETGKKYRDWESSMKAAYSAGYLSDEEIEKIAAKFTEKKLGGSFGNWGLKPVGDKEVFHVSVSADLIEKNGLLTKDEVKFSGINKMGLGGGDGISTTTDIVYAERIYRVFNEIKDALNGKVNIADEFKGFDRDTQDKIIKQMRTTLGGEEKDIRYAIENNHDGYERESTEGYFKEMRVVKERIDAAKFFGHYYNIMTMFADGRNGREWLAMSSNIGHLKDSDIGIFKMRTRPNAKGEYLPAEREIRVFSGDAVHKLKRIDKKRRKPTDLILIDLGGIVRGVKGNWEDQPRAPAGTSEGGQWISGSDVPTQIPGAAVSGGSASTKSTGDAELDREQAENLNAELLYKDAPDKAIPVVLVYGGSFNPFHRGHKSTAEMAMNVLTKNGYNVESIVVAPTADKLLRSKFAKKGESEDKAYPLDDRVEMTKLALEGGKFIVTGEPGKEAETFEGKLRRTQLADWAKKKFPGRTVINVTGEDQATGTGHSPPGFPSLYQGDKGTHHEGYYYLVLKRVGGISSTKIREQLIKGEPTPDVPEKAKKYLLEMFKKNPRIKMAWEAGIVATWEDQPRAPEGTSEGGQWVSEGFVPAGSVDEAAERIQKALGIENNSTGLYDWMSEEVKQSMIKAGRKGAGYISLFGATKEEANAILEVIESEAKSGVLNGEGERLGFLKVQYDLSEFGKHEEKTAAFFFPAAHLKNDYKKNGIVINAEGVRENILYTEKDPPTYKETLETLEKFASGFLMSPVPKETRDRIKDIKSKVSLGLERMKYFTVANMFEDPNDRVKSIVYHELAHYYVHRQWVKEGGNGMYREDKEKWMNDNIKAGYKKSNLSEYSRTNRDEYFSEWYAYYRMKGKKGVPDDVLSLIKKINSK